MSSALSERLRGRSHCRKVVRRLPARLLHGVGLFTLLSLIATGPAEAQDIWPARVIRMVNSLSAGSSADRLNRAFADALGARLNQRVLVDNRPGDGGNIAAQSVAKAPADGYTLLLASTASLAIQMTYHAGRLGYDMRRDFAPISRVAQIPNGLFATPALPADDFRGLVELAGRTARTARRRDREVGARDTRSRHQGRMKRRMHSQVIGGVQ